MWVEEKGTSADPADTSIVCGCGKRLSLQEAFIPGRLGKCRGERPWLLDKDPDGCDQNLKLLTRTATNTYFPQVLTIISLPSEEDELTKMVAELSGELTSVQSIEHVAMAKQFNARIAASLGPFSDEDIFERLKRIYVIFLGTPHCAITVPIGEFLNGKARFDTDLKGIFDRKSVALPGPRSIHRIRTAKRACPPIVPLRRARPNYYR